MRARLRRWACPTGHCRPRGAVYGLLEWHDTPVLIVGGTTGAVRREAVRILTAGGIADDDPAFAARHPAPGAAAPDTAVAAWLGALRRECGAAWFTVLTDEVVDLR